MGTSVACAADLSTYRGIQLGTDLATAAKQAGADPAKARGVHQRPAVIQELDWRPGLADATPEDPVRDGTLSFYNGKLFRMEIHYSHYQVEGMTAQDMIAGISAIYGRATRPSEKIAYHSVFSESAIVLARWENAQDVYNLVETGDDNFALVLYAKSLYAPAEAAIAESVRLDALDAPRREMEEQNRREMDAQLALEKTRSTNKINFRP